MNTPSLYGSAINNEILLRSVDIKNIGTNRMEENATYWNTLLELFTIKSPTFLQASVLKERIYSYYDA